MDMSALSTNQRIILGLTAVTAVIHFLLGILNSDILFILNGLGYLGLAAGLYFIPQLADYRAMVRWALIGFTVITIILYFVFNASASFSSPLGLLTKLVEVVLVVMLVQEAR